MVAFIHSHLFTLVFPRGDGGSVSIAGHRWQVLWTPTFSFMFSPSLGEVGQVPRNHVAGGELEPALGARPLG